MLDGPTRGWNTWNNYQCDISEDLILEQARAMKALSLHHLYPYIVIDDCWMAPARSSSGELQADPIRFPNGMKSVAEKVHAEGLLIGLYTSIGQTTCEGLPASFGHYELDAATISGWGFDFLKVDTCGLTFDQTINPAPYYEQMGKALASQDRDIVYNICNWGIWGPWKFAHTFAASWRTTTDIFPTFWRVMQIVDFSEGLAPYSALHHYNDLDMLEVGVDGTLFNWAWTPKISPLSFDESKAHLTLWAMMNSPIILGLDLVNLNIDSDIVSLLSNEKLLNLSSDPLQQPARRQLVKTTGNLFAPAYHFTGFLQMLPHICLSSDCTYVEIWTKQLEDDALAVMVFNRGSSGPREVKISLNDDLHYGPCSNLDIEDVWGDGFKYDEAENIITTQMIPPQGSTVFTLTPADASRCYYDGLNHIDAHNFKLPSGAIFLLLVIWIISVNSIKRRF